MAKIVDAFLDRNLIIYRGLQKGGAIGRGYSIELPDTENTDAEWLMSLEDSLRVDPGRQQAAAVRRGQRPRSLLDLPRELLGRRELR